MCYYIININASLCVTLFLYPHIFSYFCNPETVKDKPDLTSIFYTTLTTISLHIEYLLQRFPCVIVPGIGAFMVTTSEARIDFEKQCAHPPMRILSFNSCVNNDDSLLANSYARRMGVNFEQGQQEMLQDITLLREMLHSDKEVALGRLGILRLEEDGRIVFLARMTPEAYMAEMGMDSVTLLQKQPVTLPKQCADESESVINADNPANEQQDLQESQETSLSDNGKYVTWRISKTLLRLTASVLILLIGLGTMFTLKKYSLNETDKAPIEQASVLPVNVAEKAITTVADSLATVHETPRQIEIDADTDAYYLIVATFHRIEEARKFVEQYDSEDYPLVIIRSKKVFRVSAATSDERNQLRKLLNQDSFSQRFVQPWIWCQAD